MRIRSLLPILALLSPCVAQIQQPNIEAQRDAMKKLDFLVGKWSGPARVWEGPGAPLELIQTEEVQYKLDSLVLLVEGTGRNKSDDKVVFRALATVSYDEESKTYRFRTHSRGRYLETKLDLLESGRGFTWGFTFGQMKTNYIMKLNDKGEWTETGEVVMGGQPPRKFVEITVSRQK